MRWLKMGLERRLTSVPEPGAPQSRAGAIGANLSEDEEGEEAAVANFALPSPGDRIWHLEIHAYRSYPSDAQIAQ